MSQLEVVRKVQGMCNSHVAKPFEEVHGQRVARLPGSANKLRQYAASSSVPNSAKRWAYDSLVFNLDARSGIDNSGWEREDQSKSYTKEHGTNTRLNRG